MIKNNLTLGRRRLTYQKDSKIFFILLILSFLLGCLAGSLVGSYFKLDTSLNDFLGFSTLKTLNVVTVFFHFTRFHLVAFLLASSFYGIALLPVLSCIRGYALSCTAATIMSCYPSNGLIMALVILGIPALISLPCFFTISIEGFMSSSRIFHLVRGNSAQRKDRIYARTLVCLPFLVIGTLIEFKLVPYLATLLI
ncbi:MAG: stage II sporulation protein M [Oscillospiraceae bacterium]|nr:stage II sporulation protein M [Oscillospiraceae bacterium]